MISRLILRYVRSGTWIEMRCLGVFVGALFTLTSVQASAQCTLRTTDPSVTVCTPTVNSVVPISPVHVTAGSTDSAYAVTTMQAYVDNKLVYQVKSAKLDTYLPLTVGNHLLTVQGWDSGGRTFKYNVPLSETPPCALNSTNRTVVICTPGASAALSVPVHLVAGIHDSSPVTSIRVLRDGAQIYSTTSGKLDVYVTGLTTGSHTLTVTAQDSAGSFSKSVGITVPPNSALSKIRHIIYLVQENRSFDNYFGKLGQYRVSKGLPNNIDGIPANAAVKNTQGQSVPSFHYQTVCTENLSPFWNETHLDIDGGLMDGFARTSTSVPSTIDPTGTRVMGYYDQTDLPYYYELATQFATSDRFFSASNRIRLRTACIFLRGHRSAISGRQRRRREAGRSLPFLIISIRRAFRGATTTRTMVLICRNGRPTSGMLRR
jgi:phospholipase C